MTSEILYRCVTEEQKNSITSIVNDQEIMLEIIDHCQHIFDGYQSFTHNDIGITVFNNESHILLFVTKISINEIKQYTIQSNGRVYKYGEIIDK